MQKPRKREMEKKSPHRPIAPSPIHEVTGHQPTSPPAHQPTDHPRIAIVTFSDRSSRGEREDLTGPGLKELVESYGWKVEALKVVPDDLEEGKKVLLELSSAEMHLILTNGGTGCAPRDITPEATLAVIEKEIPGLPEVMRAESLKISPHAMISRARAGIRGNTLILNLPGSPKAARECLEMVMPALPHALELITGEGPFDCATKHEH